MSQTLAGRRSANRRRRSETRQQILDVARRQLTTKPFRDLTIDDLMKPTGFGRTAFYRYFPDREAVLFELLEELWGELRLEGDAAGFGASASGLGTFDAEAIGRLYGLVAKNRALFKAIEDAAGGDAEIELAYRTLMRDYWIHDLQARVIDAQAHGFAVGLDPEVTAEALGWMVERFVEETGDRDPRLVVDTIVTIVARCVYGPSFTPELT
jgi:AcrR family transcriptional regulator